MVERLTWQPVGHCTYRPAWNAPVTRSGEIWTRGDLAVFVAEEDLTELFGARLIHIPSDHLLARGWVEPLLHIVCGLPNAACRFPMAGSTPAGLRSAVPAQLADHLRRGELFAWAFGYCVDCDDEITVGARREGEARLHLFCQRCLTAHWPSHPAAHVSGTQDQEHLEMGGDHG